MEVTVVLGIAIFLVSVIQIMMVVKFFEIASDMKDIRNMLAKSLQHKSTNIPNAEQTKSQSTEGVEKNVGASKFTWQSWVAIIIIIAGIILYFVGR